MPFGSVPQRGIEENSPRRQALAEMLRGGRRQKNFFDAPLGPGGFGGETGGRARCAGLPPANFLRSPSGTKSKVSDFMEWDELELAATAIQSNR